MASTILVVNSVLNPINTVYGTPSASQTAFFSGTEIADQITITAPLNFEVSLDNVTFTDSVNKVGVGTITSTPVYIRAKATAPAGTYTGNIVFTSTGATTVNKAIPESIVSKAVLTLTPDNKSRTQGAPNPAFTFVATGYQNSETVSVLTKQPVIASIANDVSPVGTYPIDANGAEALNYTFVYVDGVLTVTAIAKPSISALVATVDEDVQYSVLKSYGVLSETIDDNYLDKRYIYKYTVGADTATFIVITKQGNATIVLVDTKFA